MSSKNTQSTIGDLSGYKCVEPCLHSAAINIAKDTLPTKTELLQIAELYKVFGDATRVKMLYVLLKQELCVCDITEALGMTQSAISHQLRVLKVADLVKNRREGKTVFYSLADDHVATILQQGLEHIQE